jgi:acetoin:2,6-dichlorophenolindophenol oxidoreductase subunit beta
LKANDELERQGVQAEVIALRSLSPLDLSLVLESVEQTGRLIAVDEEDPLRYGIGDHSLGLKRAVRFS